MQIIVRMFIAGIVYYIAIVRALPLFLAAISFTLPAPVMGLLQLAAAVVALWYVFWGPPVPMPGRTNG